MSNVSPIDENLYVVYSRLLPVEFREYLLNRKIELIEDIQRDQKEGGQTAQRERRELQQPGRGEGVPSASNVNGAD